MVPEALLEKLEPMTISYYSLTTLKTIYFIFTFNFKMISK